MKPTRDQIASASSELIHAYWRTASNAVDALEQALEVLPRTPGSTGHDQLRSWWFQILLLNEEIQARKQRGAWWCVCEVCFEPFPD